MKKVLSVILALMMSASTWTAVYAAEGDGKVLSVGFDGGVSDC